MRQEENRKENRNYDSAGSGKKKKKKNHTVEILIVIIMALCLVIFGISVYKLITIRNEYQEGEEDYDSVREQAFAILNELEISGEEKTADEKTLNSAEEETDLSEEAEAEEEETEEELPNHERNEAWFDQLEAVYPGIVAWITISDTAIDYPVMYSGDNTYYLTHTATGLENGAGSIFLDCFCDPELSGKWILLYGHNMKNGSMFAGVLNWQSQEYWSAHRYITLETRKGTLTYEIFSYEITTTDNEIYYYSEQAAADDFDSFVARRLANSVYMTGVTADGSDQILCLSTCEHATGSGRLVLNARRVKAEEQE